MRSVSDVRFRRPRFMLYTALAMLVCLSSVGCDFNKQKREALAEGDRLYPTDPAAAIVKYKEGYDAAGPRKADVLQRIVDHEARPLNAVEAMKWIEKGLNEKLQVEYTTPKARELLAQVQHERAEAEAKKQAEKDAKNKAKGAANEKAARYGSYTEAMSQAEKVVRRNLPSPNDATFRALGEPVVQNPDGSWQVSGRVTTRDAFGSLVTYRFRGTMMKTNDRSWESVGDIVLDPE